MIPYSVLDLAPIAEGRDAAASFAHSADLAKHAESWGYNRFWLAEHHNMPGIASAATSVVIGHVAAATSTIRVGAGGVMLPNHSPLVIAEQFGTLATLFPDRIDCGLGRAPGTDMVTARALRRSKDMNDQFPQDVVELMSYFDDPQPGQQIKAVLEADEPLDVDGLRQFAATQLAAYKIPKSFDVVDALPREAHGKLKKRLLRDPYWE